MSFIQVVLFLCIVFGVHFIWAMHRVKQWASRNGFTLVKCKLCFANIGPFSYFGASGNQAVFRLEVMNKEGQIRKAYARTGGFIF